MEAAEDADETEDSETEGEGAEIRGRRHGDESEWEGGEQSEWEEGPERRLAWARLSGTTPPNFLLKF